MDIINNSSLEHPDLLRIISAINKSIPEICSAWNKPIIELSIKKKSKKSQLVLSDYQTQDRYGFHTFVNGYPFGRGYMKSDIETNSRIISHEVFEMIVNPQMNKDAFCYQLEVCDPVMDNFFDVDGIKISDWVYPSWFYSGDPPYNKLNTLQKPFELSKEGYILKTNTSSPS